MKKILVIAMIAALGIACGSSEPLTVHEYAERFCDRDDVFSEDEIITNGEVLDRLDDFLEETLSLTPPDDLAEYHTASVHLIRGMEEVVENMDEDEIFSPSPWSLLLLGLAAGTQLEEAEAGLSPETVAIMNEAGCDIGDDS